MKYCEMSDLPVESCAHCRTGSRTLPDTMFQANEMDASKLGPQVPAKYHGQCTGCGAPIRPGDLIRSDGVSGWVDEQCAR
jgi:hypothetical protein